MRRREFIAFVGGAAIWPFAARAQQSTGTRRIGMLLTFSTDEPETRAGVAAFRQGLQQAGWNEGGNLEIEIR
jgi:putative tryptophan/tyrosine transport system substrate-binding protein